MYMCTHITNANNANNNTYCTGVQADSGSWRWRRVIRASWHSWIANKQAYQNISQGHRHNINDKGHNTYTEHN